MKVIALLPLRNDQPFIRTFLSGITPLVDEIVAIDHGSLDHAPQLLEEAGATVLRGPPPDRSRGRRLGEQRQALLEAGRRRGGTHFVWLDADEAFTAPFLARGRSLIGSLSPGTKLVMRWVALWQSPRRFRNDDSLWGNSWKDFVFADDPSLNFLSNDPFHEPRTPGPNDAVHVRRLPVEDGAVLHFQFLAWDRFQMKQAWYRCWELMLGEKRPVEINHLYHATLDEKGATSPVPDKWLIGLNIPSDLQETRGDWYREEIVTWFEERGPLFFEPLQIWHIPSLRDEFVARVGREPRSQHLRVRFRHMRIRVAESLPSLAAMKRSVASRVSR